MNAVALKFAEGGGLEGMTLQPANSRFNPSSVLTISLRAPTPPVSSCLLASARISWLLHAFIDTPASVSIFASMMPSMLNHEWQRRPRPAG